MNAMVEIKVPDIGDFKDVEVIEVLVVKGDKIQEGQGLITVESDKASIEIPASQGGTVKSLKVKVGDKVSKGTSILELIEDLEPGNSDKRATNASEVAATPASPGTAEAASGESQTTMPSRASTASLASSAPGDALALQTFKDDAHQRLASHTSNSDSHESLGLHDANASRESAASPAASVPREFLQNDVFINPNLLPHASPSVRKFARELGADLARVTGSGIKGRITKEDVQAFVKQALSGENHATVSSVASQGGTLGGMTLLPWPQVDFAAFGPIETQPLSRIQKISGANLHRNWVSIPHVTNNDEADITELESLRRSVNKENEKTGVKVTILAFLMKAVVAALKQYPAFNASLDGDNLVLKHYYHLGCAVDTPKGLMVPVIRDVDTKGILQIAQEAAELARKAQAGKLLPGEMQGGCFSISSLGGIGGTHFTPIINAPEVAILGLSRAYYKPVWDGKQFMPRLMLPLSLSYDHRVIDGATAARFNTYLSTLLADFRRIAL